MIRQAHERPEGMDQGVVIMSGLKSEEVLQAINVVTQMKPSPVIPDYDTENVSDKVVKIILNYAHYINRTVWYKD